MTPATRSVTFYRLTLAAPALAAVYLAASGRFAAQLDLFRSALLERRLPSSAALFDANVTAFVWVLSVAPFLFASWELGRQHTRAWRGGTELLTGMASVFRIAFRGQLGPEASRTFSLSPSDRPGVAALWGVGVGGLLPGFFLAVVPELRHARGVLWLVVAGLLAGLGEFFRRRAMPFVHDERRGLFSPRWISPARCEPAGKRFAAYHLAASFALPAWWLIGGALLAFK